MTSRFDISGPRAGVTLFETMVALGVLSLILAVVATSVRPPSPQLQTKATIAALVQDVQTARLRAIQEGRDVTLETDNLCAGARAPVFFPDGSARFGPLCVGTQEIQVLAITGTLDLDSVSYTHLTLPTILLV